MLGIAALLVLLGACGDDGEGGSGAGEDTTSSGGSPNGGSDTGGSSNGGSASGGSSTGGSASGGASTGGSSTGGSSSGGSSSGGAGGEGGLGGDGGAGGGVVTFCTPNEVEDCAYTGPANTENVGPCVSGTRTCLGDGSAFGACMGEVLPATENCATATDENCDGQTPPCAMNEPIIDLRADNNRNGVIEFAVASEDANESVWSAANGAIFLANIDDDDLSCPTMNQSDAELAACNDASDAVTNGAADLEDLARIKTAPWAAAPSNASATISLTTNAGTPTNFVRLFKRTGNTFTNFTPAGSTLTAAELQAGVEFAIEAKDIVRNPATWDGYVTITLNVDAGSVNGMNLQDGSDSVELRVAPALFRHHLDENVRTYVSNTGTGSSQVFREDLADAVALAGVPNATTTFSVTDQWTQDFFETAYMSMPAPNGAQKVIHVNFRSANFPSSGTLRAAGRVVFTQLRGVDVAGAVAYDPNHTNSMDTLNSFGNLETIPPYTHAGVEWANGRVVRGRTNTFYPDTAFDTMIDAQDEQNVLAVDTSWLLVAHIDETISFIKASTPRGWVMLAADPTLAVSFFQQLEQAGYGNVDMFVGKTWSGGASAQISVSETLDDTDVMNESAWAATQVEDQVTTIKGATGLVDSEIVTVPFLFEQSSGYSGAFQPGTVNGIYLSDTVFAPPDPHGPTINGTDPFQADLIDVLGDHGVTVSWVENWDLYHRLKGEVHCGTNVTRAIPTTPWWQ